MKINETHIQLFGLVMIFYAMMTVGFNSFFDLITEPAKRNIKAPIMSLEFVRNATDVEEITKNDPEAQNGLKTFLLFDSFAFVPLYFGFLLVMSFFLSQTSFDWVKTAAVLVVFAAIIAAAADWTENYYSYLALENKTENFNRIYWAAHAKWLMIFFATGILSFIFYRWNGWAVSWAVLLFSSLVGLSLTLGSVLRIANLSKYHHIITGALLLQLLVLLIVGILFQFQRFRLGFLSSY